MDDNDSNDSSSKQGPSGRTDMSSSDNENNMQRPDMNGSGQGEMADGGFAGAGENSVSSITLTTTYIIIIGVLSLIISLDLIYLIMSGFNNHKVFTSKNKIIIYVLSNIVLTGLLTLGVTLFGNKVYLNSSSNLIIFSLS